LDESFTSFAKIHELTQELRNPESMDPTVRQEKEEALSAAQSKAKSYMSLTKETVAMLKLFTEALAESFTVPEIVQRLADMLDYNLDALVGPRCENLQVKNREKYKFNPRELLGDILQVYLNLSEQGEFVKAVANDGRSYKKELFEKAASIATKRFLLKSDSDIERLRLFVVKVEECKATMEAEDDLEEVPDEFLGKLIRRSMHLLMLIL
jgi:ubiquitin conjugation factor E4 B